MVCPFGQKGFGDCLTSVSIRQLDLTWKGSTISLDGAKAYLSFIYKTRTRRASLTVPGGGHIGNGCVRDLLLLIAGRKNRRTAAGPRLLPVRSVFEAAGPAKLQIGTQTMPLSEIAEAWEAPGKRRIVVTIQ
jgi:hypothetical protein